MLLKVLIALIWRVDEQRQWFLSRVGLAVSETPRIRACLGAPLFDEQGHALGTLCVLDHEARDFTAAEREVLERCAKAVQPLMHR